MPDGTLDAAIPIFLWLSGYGVLIVTISIVIDMANTAQKSGQQYKSWIYCTIAAVLAFAGASFMFGAIAAS